MVFQVTETCPGFLRMSGKGGAREREVCITQPVSRHTVVITAVFAPIYSPPRYVTTKKLWGFCVGERKKKTRKETHIRVRVLYIIIIIIGYCMPYYILKQMNKLTNGGGIPPPPSRAVSNDVWRARWNNNIVHPDLSRTTNAEAACAEDRASWFERKESRSAL